MATVNWGWLNDGRIFIFGWTITSRKVLSSHFFHNFLFVGLDQACQRAWGMGQCRTTKCQHKVQWAPTSMGASRTRICLCHLPGKVCHACLKLRCTPEYLQDVKLVLYCYRHNTYLQECTGQREPTYQLNIHDTKLLFLRFAMEQSFSVDTGGGGRESNIHLIPYIIHTILYVLNTYACQRWELSSSVFWDSKHFSEFLFRTRATSREEKNLQSFLEQPCEKWVETSYEVDGPHYFTILAMHILPPERWRTTRLDFLRRLLVTSHARKVSPGGANK